MPDFNLLDEAPVEPQKPKLEEIKLETDDVPEELKGKSVKDILAQMDALKNSLRVSEEARQQALTMAQVATQQQPTPPPAPKPEEPEFSSEKFKEMMAEDPAAAFEYGIKAFNAMQQRQFESRILPLQQSTMTTAEQYAKNKYAEEFAVLGPEIKAIVDQIPANVKASALADPEAWDRIVDYARGKNFDKLFQHRMKKTQQTVLDEARKEQAADAPPNIVSQARTQPVTGDSVTWDATMDEIARNLGMTKEDYIAWMKR